MMRYTGYDERRNCFSTDSRATYHVTVWRGDIALTATDASLFMARIKAARNALENCVPEEQPEVFAWLLEKFLEVQQ